MLCILWYVRSTGHHTCPGKGTTINVLKMYLAKIIREFDVEVICVSRKNHLDFGPSRYQKIIAKVKPFEPKDEGSGVL